MNRCSAFAPILLAAVAFAALLPAMPCAANDLEFGAVYAGVAKSSKSGKVWPFEINFDRLDERAPSTLWGQISWPSLRSVHILDARLEGDRLSFTEVEAAEKGKAHLKVRYEGRITGPAGDRRIEGSYTDPAGDHGTFAFELVKGGSDLRSLGFLSGRPLSGEAKSAKSGKAWPFTLTLDGERATELFDYEGTLEWPTLGSRHRVRGLYKGGRLLFAEVEAIRKGKAHLKVEYEFWRDGNGLTGAYRDPKGDRGTAWIALE